MSKKKEEVPAKKPLLGRVKNHLKMGIVGLPNVGKSSLFNILTKTTNAKADNFPFCTIEPNEARVPLPDERYNWLCEMYKPASKVPAYLEVWDIAGLVKGASEGEGLGNAFLSNISAVDGIFQVIRIFEDQEVTHVEGNIDPIRDLEIIENELRLKDLALVQKQMAPIVKLAGSDPKQRPVLAMFQKIHDHLQANKNIIDGDWNNKEIDLLNTLLLLTAKPTVYLLNLSLPDYISQKNRWLPKVVKWIREHHADAPVLPMCVTLEDKLVGLDPADAAELLKSYGDNVKSSLDKIVRAGFQALQLQTFFTCGSDEVRAWPVMAGTHAPQAAGTIHTDFESHFIRAEVMAFDDLKKYGSESEVRSNGRYRTEGKAYEVQDGDIMLIKHNAGGAGKKK